MFSNFSYFMQLLPLGVPSLREEATGLFSEGIPTQTPRAESQTRVYRTDEWIGRGGWGGEKRERRMEEQRKTGIEGQTERNRQ